MIVIDFRYFIDYVVILVNNTNAFVINYMEMKY